MKDAAVSPDKASTSALKSHSRVRTALATVSLGLPAVAVSTTGLAWLKHLPAHVAFHWGASGSPDGFFPTEPLFWIALVASSLFGCMGFAALFIPSRDRDDTRKSVTIVGAVSAVTACAWIVPAASTYTAESASQAAIGCWLLLFLVALAYGTVPRLLMTRE